MKRATLKSWLYCLPALIVIIIVAFVPLAETLVFAFTNARLGFLDAAKWVGLQNFVFLIVDENWWLSVTNTLIFAFFSVPLEILFGLFLALLLNRHIPGRGFLRAAVLIPWAVPTVVSARMWAWMFNDLYGIINELLLWAGIIDQPWAWLANRSLSMTAMIIVDVWKSTPFAALLLLAGLQGIPKTLYEAAELDGASRWSQFRNITLPLLMPAILVAVIFRMLDALRVFDLPFVLTSNSKHTMVMSMFARQQLIDFQDVGYGSAVSFLIFCVIGVIAALYLYLGRRNLWGEA